MVRRESGFTLIELIFTFVIVAILAAMAVVNFSAMQKRAREAATKANMHTFQLAVEDYSARNGGAYPTSASLAAALLTRGGAAFCNPFTNKTGSGNAWLDRSSWATKLTSGSTVSGIVAYGDSVGAKYQIVGRGAKADLTVILAGGR